MKSALVSVVIPTRNRLPYLRQAIDSALSQHCPDCEIIVVDDGSADGTAAALHAWDAPGLRYRSIGQRGVAAARNVGIGMATGSFIAFLDSDDLWCPDKLAAQLAYFERHRATAMVATNFRFVDADGANVQEPAKPFGYAMDDHFIADVLAAQCPLATPTIMVKKAVFDSVGLFNENLRVAEDLDMWVRIGLRHEVGYLDRVTASVRLHEQHTMRQCPRDQVWLQSVRVLESHRAAISAQVAGANAHFARFYARAGNIALLSGARMRALPMYGRAMLRAPTSFKSYKDLLRCALPLAYLRRRSERFRDLNVHPLMQLYR
jgi:glycosyltransferase involved in cell wall biosynthesis